VLTIYHSNRLDILKDLLIALIKRQPLSNPLQDEQILVQSPGMAQWLRLQLAEELGVAAAINFPLPASFLWEMYIHILPHVPKRSAFNKETMTWKIMVLVKQMLNQDNFAPLKNYLTEDDDDLKSYQLAGKIADIFDQYLVYRPDWILKWEQDDGLDAIPHKQLWQPELWRALVAKTAELNQPHWHRANMHQQFNEKITRGKSVHTLPKRFFVFGISALPPHFIESLHTLSQQTDVHLMITNPCRYFWGDIKDPKYLAKMKSRHFLLNNDQRSERKEPFYKTSSISGDDCTNPLLASMGKLGRDYLYQIHDLDAVDIDAFADIPRTTLLKHIQADILDLADSSSNTPKPEIKKNDTSFRIHNCHSPIREVEVLHDQLLAIFAKHQDITPKDIVIMLPNVDAYSPWIQTVFGSIPKQDPRYIPFSISDNSVRTEHPLLTGVLKLLNIDNSRCTAPELLDLLDIPALQRRFKLNQNDLETLRQWVNDTGIRWGINSHQQSRFDLPIMSINTWQFGLRRMLLGYAMPESSGIHAGILPFDGVQGLNACLCGQLADFLEQIEQLSTSLNQEYSIDEWTRYVNNLLEQFFLPNKSDEYPLKIIHDAMEHLHEQLHDADHQQPLTKSIIVSYLTERIIQRQNSKRFLAGQVNFCTLMPMRSIPFKIVCLLGMNDGAYPRSIDIAGFDLIAQNSRRGDRSRRDDDRYLFLEALLSAQQQFYISYVGKSIIDSSPRAPSVLVTELLNYCQQGFIGQKDPDTPLAEQLITEHPLQAFSPSVFASKSKKENDISLFSYAREWLPAARRKGQRPPPFIVSPLKATNIPDSIEISELIRFFRNTSKYFCNHRLKVFFDDNEKVLAENESFELDGLTQYSLKQELLEALILDQPSTQVLALRQASGYLPHGAFGEVIVDEQVKALTSMSNHIRDLTTSETLEEDIEIGLNIGDIHLCGWLKQLYSGGLIRYRPSPIKGKDIITTWIEHLCYCATRPSRSTRLIGLDHKKRTYQQRTFNNLPADKAIDYLDALMSVYKEGLTYPQPLFPETALALLNSTGDDEQAVKRARLCFEGNPHGSGNFAEGDDPYISRIYPSFDSSYQTIRELSIDVLNPALSHSKAGGSS